MYRARRGLVLGLVSLGFLACATSQPGVKNVAGTIQTVLPATPPEVHAAARGALDEMRLRVVSSAVTTIDARLVARTALEREVTIDAALETEHVTQLRIHVGPFGDEPLSLVILEKIKARL